MFRLIFVILWWGTLNSHYNECIVHMCIWYNCFSSKVDNHLKWRIACLIYSGMQTYCSSNYINLILCFYIFLVVQQMNARANYKILKWVHSMSRLTSPQCNLRFNLAAKWSIIYIWFMYCHRNSNTTHLSGISNDLWSKKIYKH